MKEGPITRDTIIILFYSILWWLLNRNCHKTIRNYFMALNKSSNGSELFSWMTRFTFNNVIIIFWVIIFLVIQSWIQLWLSLARQACGILQAAYIIYNTFSFIKSFLLLLYMVCMLGLWMDGWGAQDVVGVVCACVWPYNLYFPFNGPSLLWLSALQTFKFHRYSARSVNVLLVNLRNRRKACKKN